MTAMAVFANNVETSLEIDKALDVEKGKGERESRGGGEEKFSFNPSLMMLRINELDVIHTQL